MKAFEITWKQIPKSKGFYAAPTAGKAKYHAASILDDCSYVDSIGSAFRDLTCRRRPDLDVWASQFNRVTSRGAEYVCSDLEGDRDD